MEDENEKKKMQIYLSINDKDESSTTSKYVLRVKCWVKEVYLARKIPDL